MKTFFGFIVLFSTVFVNGCASNAMVKGYEKDQILSTLGDKPIPEWAEKGESEPLRFVGDKVYSVGVTTLRGNERPEAGARISENNSRANYAKTIENKLQFIFQNSEENQSLDSTQAKFIGSEVSTLTSHSMTQEGSWWKRYAQSDEDGSRHIYYKIYSLVTMPVTEMKKAIDASIAGKVSEHKLSETFQAQVSKQWDQITGQTTDARKPAAQ